MRELLDEARWGERWKTERKEAESVEGLGTKERGGGRGAEL